MHPTRFAVRRLRRRRSSAQSSPTVPLGLIEVRGRAAVGGLRGYDVVIAIDVSDSTTRDSGVDVDRDGPAGETDPVLRRWLGAQPDADRHLLEQLAARDFDDSILMAELAAARA